MVVGTNIGAHDIINVSKKRGSKINAKCMK
jgi:hypothetical protein